MKIKYETEIEGQLSCGNCPFNYEECGCFITGTPFPYDEEENEEANEEDNLVLKDCPLQVER